MKTAYDKSVAPSLLQVWTQCRGVSPLLLINFAVKLTSIALSVAIFHVLQNLDVYTKLLQEIRAVQISSENLPAVSYLEKLPYLVGRSLLLSFLPY